MPRRILITGGAGFVGASVAVALAGRADWEIVALDNLRRRGSELNLPRLQEAGVTFVHGDVRRPSDLLDLDPVDAVVEASAEPSARSCRASRPRASASSSPSRGARTLYGASKLAAELVIAEYAAAYGVRSVINRCGVIAGPWQMGKADQGVSAIGSWRTTSGGRSVTSDMGHGKAGQRPAPRGRPGRFRGRPARVARRLGRGDRQRGRRPRDSLSLREASELCADLTGNRVGIEADPEERPGDVPLYLSDCAILLDRTDWRPRRDARQMLENVFAWVHSHERDLARLV